MLKYGLLLAAAGAALVVAARRRRGWAVAVSLVLFAAFTSVVWA